MIYGIGTDIVEIDRIKKIKSHDTFANKILGSDELQEYKKLKGELKISFLGKHFAAKEAFVKALGTGFIEPVFPKGIQVISSNNGKPKYSLSNSIKSHIDSLGISRAHVSIADERNHLIAFAVLEI